VASALRRSSASPLGAFETTCYTAAVRSIRLAWALLAATALGCISSRSATAVDLRGRRLVGVDRPIVLTEFAKGRRVLRLDLPANERGVGLVFALELDDPGVPPTPSERTLELPSKTEQAAVVVNAAGGVAASSRALRGTVRIRDFGDRAVFVLDLDFPAPKLGDQAELPAHVSRDGEGRWRLSGAFEALAQ